MKRWKLRVGTPLGTVQEKLGLSPSLHKLAHSIINERVVTKPKGSTRPRFAKFTDPEVRILRKIWAAELVKTEDLADLFDMTVNSMKHILDGTNYSKVL